jgi:lipoprotein-anchoring transpeptidase ErfK/SrfK
MIKMFIALLVVLASFVPALAGQKYTISVCMTLSLENALICKKSIFDNMDGKVFIVKDKDERYYTYLDIFDNKDDAKLKINRASAYVKQQKPYVKEISKKVVELYSKKKAFIDLNEVPKKSRVQEVFVMKEKEQNIQEQKKQVREQNKERIQLVSRTPSIDQLELVSSYPFDEGQKLSDDDYEDKTISTKDDESKKLEELKLISMDEFDKADDEKQVEAEPLEQEKKVLITHPVIEKTQVIESLEEVEVVQKIEEKPKKEIVEVVMNNSEDEPTILNYEELIIEVDPLTNIMTVNAKIDNKLKEIKEYRVSTAKKDVARPFGEGRISKISLNPIWYPTQDTLKSFRKRGINLPSVVPPGHKYNYMGAAKINLTHIVDGKNTFRIHGTLNEKTIGTNESAGCIRMKNSDVLQLAALINDFSAIKSLNDVKVILK